MVQIVIRHKVEDFDKWKELYDEHESMRKESGCKSFEIFRNGEDSNEVVIVFDWDSLENFNTFAGSESLREAMQKAGVVEKPDFYFSS